jgi:hypothetical protein
MLMFIPFPSSTSPLDIGGNFIEKKSIHKPFMLQKVINIKTHQFINIIITTKCPYLLGLAIAHPNIIEMTQILSTSTIST